MAFYRPTTKNQRKPMVSYNPAAGISPEYAAKRRAQLTSAANYAAGIGNGGAGGGLAGDYQKAYDEAKAANEQRYGEILGGYQSRYGGAMETLAGLGEQERKDLRQSYAEQSAKQNQFLASRGLAGTSLAPTLATGLKGQESEAMTRLNESLKRERLGYQTGLSGDTLSFMERREDEYPDYAQLERLAAAQGQSGTGYGNVGTGLLGSTGQRPGFSGFQGAYFPGAGAYAVPKKKKAATAASFTPQQQVGYIMGV